MPPRRAPFDPHWEEMQRELHQLQAKLADYAPWRNPSYAGSMHGEEEDEAPGHQGSSGEEEYRPRRFGATYQRRDYRPPHHDYGVKVDIPPFEGSTEPDEFIDWLQEVERIFEYKEVPEEKQVKLAAIKLKKSASRWWENMKQNRLRDGKGKITTWEKMKKEMQKKYLPSHYKQDVYLRRHNLQQKEMSVDAYNAEFEQLIIKSGIQEQEEHRITRYLGGL